MSISSLSKEPRPWRNSEAQRVLQELLTSGEVPSSTAKDAMAPLEVWERFCVPRKEFAGFQYAKFPDRLRAMRRRHLAKTGRADEEYAALVHHKQHFPTPTHNHWGEPQWHGSDAERLLKIDIAAKQHEPPSTPKLLYGTRIEYQVYPLDVFRKHIHQEVHLQKLKNQYGSKKKK